MVSLREVQSARLHRLKVRIAPWGRPPRWAPMPIVCLPDVYAAPAAKRSPYRPFYCILRCPVIPHQAKRSGAELGTARRAHIEIEKFAFSWTHLFKPFHDRATMISTRPARRPCWATQRYPPASHSTSWFSETYTSPDLLQAASRPSAILHHAEDTGGLRGTESPCIERALTMPTDSPATAKAGWSRNARGARRQHHRSREQPARASTLARANR